MRPTTSKSTARKHAPARSEGLRQMSLKLVHTVCKDASKSMSSRYGSKAISNSSLSPFSRGWKRSDLSKRLQSRLCFGFALVLPFGSDPLVLEVREVSVLGGE